METRVGNVVWAIVLAVVTAAMVASLRPVAHCHDGTCHAHGVR